MKYFFVHNLKFNKQSPDTRKRTPKQVCVAAKKYDRNYSVRNSSPKRSKKYTERKYDIKKNITNFTTLFPTSKGHF